MKLDHYIRVFDGSLSSQQCDQLIALFAALPQHHRRSDPSSREGLTSSSWVELNLDRVLDANASGFMRSLIDASLARYNQEVALPIPLPNSPLLSPLIMKRYGAGSTDGFELHFDSIYEVSDRYLVFLWYLNDVEGGGATRFPQLDVEVQPRKGRLLMFPPYWMYQHQGMPSPLGDKYIMSTYLRFPRLPDQSV